jgi:DNA repair exonuclease SbcCD nuclease subunit
MRVWAVSDIHTDYADNLEWLRQLTSPGGSAASGEAAAESFKQDALLLAGDISDSLETLTKTLEMCVTAFGHVFFTPGNHGAPGRRGGLPACGRLVEEGVGQLCPECRCSLRPASCTLPGWRLLIMQAPGPLDPS